MPKLPPPRFVINTPVGDIELDPVEIKDVWAYVAESVVLIFKMNKLKFS